MSIRASNITFCCDFICFYSEKHYLRSINHIIMSVLHLGQAIKNRRKELKITQPHLAALAQISVNTLYKFEKGQSNPSLEVLLKLAEVLGMELLMVVKKNQ